MAINDSKVLAFVVAGVVGAGAASVGVGAGVPPPNKSKSPFAGAAAAAAGAPKSSKSVVGAGLRDVCCDFALAAWMRAYRYNRKMDRWIHR